MRVLHHVATAFAVFGATGLAVQWLSPWLVLDVVGWAMLAIGALGELFFGLLVAGWRVWAWATDEGGG